MIQNSIIVCNKKEPRSRKIILHIFANSEIRGNLSPSALAESQRSEA